MNYTLKERNGSLNPNDIKKYCFPNWFDKEHFEIFLNRKLTNKEFERLKDAVVEDCCDDVSEIVSTYLRTNADEILKGERR